MPLFGLFLLSFLVERVWKMERKVAEGRGWRIVPPPNTSSFLCNLSRVFQPLFFYVFKSVYCHWGPFLTIINHTHSLGRVEGWVGWSHVEKESDVFPSPNYGNTVVLILNVCVEKHPDRSVVRQWRSSESVFICFLIFCFISSWTAWCELSLRNVGLMRSGVEMNINMYIGMVYDPARPQRPCSLTPAGHAGKLSSQTLREMLVSSDGRCGGTREKCLLGPQPPRLFIDPKTKTFPFYFCFCV